MAFEVNTCQYLAATDRQQSHLCNIFPFHMFTAVQTGGEGKIKKNQKRLKKTQNKTCEVDSFIACNLHELLKRLWNSAARSDSNNVLFFSGR